MSFIEQICDDKVNLSAGSWRHCHSDFTSTTFTQLSQVITDLIAKSFEESSAEVIKFKKTSIMCMACFTLIDRVDELQETFKVS